MEDPRRKDFDIIAIQEPWRNTYDHVTYNPRASGFYLVDNKQAGSRVSIYVNKEISIGSWEETFHSPDVVTVALRLAGVELALPRGTITREARRGDTTERTTIDLVWASAELID
jgi:hypothetical protein